MEHTEISKNFRDRRSEHAARQSRGRLWRRGLHHHQTVDSGMTDGDMTACLSGITRDGVPFGAVHTVFDMDGDGHRDVDEETIGTSTLSPDADRVCLKNEVPAVFTTPGASFFGSRGGGAV
jgi:hypothetical protein